MHPQIRIIHNEWASRCQTDCAINCLQTLLEQLLVVVKTAPAFAIKGISNIELCPWISLGGVSALPFVASRSELFPPKEIKRRIKVFLVYLVGTGSDLSAGRHFFELAGFNGVDPGNEHGIGNREHEAPDLNQSGLHSFRGTDVIVSCFNSSQITAPTYCVVLSVELR